MNPISITVSGVGSLFAQGILKCLHASNIEVLINGLDYFDSAFGFRWCDSRSILPDLLNPNVSEDDWFDALVESILRSNSKFLFIGVEFELLPVSTRADELFAITGCRAIVSRQELIRSCNDKYLTIKMLNNNDLDTPLSFIPEDGINTIINKISFPMLVKPRFGARSRGVIIVNDYQMLISAIDKTDRPIIQEYLINDDLEFTCGITMIKENIDSISILRRTLRDGNTWSACSEHRVDVENLCIRVGQSLKPFGPLNIQLRIHNEQPKIFEINPRFSGTTIFRSLLGINEPERILSQLIGNKVEKSPKLRLGKVVRFFDEVVEY
jgi:carbamoyl-phosphate synthase large subunit